MKNDEFLNNLENLKVPGVPRLPHEQNLRRMLLNSKHFQKNSWNSVSMNRKALIFSAALVVLLLVVGFNIFQKPTNHAQAQEIVQNALNSFSQLSQDQQETLNKSLNTNLNQLLNDAHAASDLAYYQDQFGNNLSYTDNLGRKVTFLIDNNATVKFIKFNGESYIVETNGWKTFSSPELGVTFQYPEKYKDISFSINPGITGKMANGFISEFTCSEPPCNRAGIEFGSNTSNYTAANEGGLGGVRYQKKNGNYFALGADGKEYQLPQPSYELQTKNTVGIVYVGNYSGVHGPGAVPADTITAMFNLNSSEFETITFKISTNEISEQEFTAILKTIEVK